MELFHVSSSVYLLQCRYEPTFQRRINYNLFSTLPILNRSSILQENAAFLLFSFFFLQIIFIIQHMTSRTKSAIIATHQTHSKIDRWVSIAFINSFETVNGINALRFARRGHRDEPSPTYFPSIEPGSKAGNLPHKNRLPLMTLVGSPRNGLNHLIEPRTFSITQYFGFRILIISIVACRRLKSG